MRRCPPRNAGARMMNDSWASLEERILMIVSLFHVTVPAEAAERFEQSWTQRAGQVDKMPGFEGLEVLKDGATPGRYIILTRWETKADFDGWAQSPAFAHAY